MSLEKFKLGYGTEIRFWKDIWLVAYPLKAQYPNFYNIVWHEYATVENTLDVVPLKFPSEGL